MSDGREYVSKVPDFGSESPESMSEAVDDTIKSYLDLTADLREQLQRDDLSDERKVYAFYLAGQLRASNCVTVLLQRIDLKAPVVDAKDEIGRWGMYPAQEALAKIGKPAVNMIVDKLPDESNPLRQKLMCQVLADVDGPDVAQFMLERAHKAEGNRRRQMNLEAALAIVEKLPR